MRRIPRTLSADGAPEGEIERPEVLRRYEVTVEREFVAVRSQTDEEFMAFCPGCGHDVVMITPERGANAIGCGVRMVYRWIEEKKVNFVEPGAGKVFVCFESVQRASGFMDGFKEISSGESK
jgi:hypothetical protein